MRITTMLNAMTAAANTLLVSSKGDCIYHKRYRQFHAFRDGIHRRWIRMEQEREYRRNYMDRYDPADDDIWGSPDYEERENDD